MSSLSVASFQGDDGQVLLYDEGLFFAGGLHGLQGLRVSIVSSAADALAQGLTLKYGKSCLLVESGEGLWHTVFDDARLAEASEFARQVNSRNSTAVNAQPVGIEAVQPTVSAPLQAAAHEGNPVLHKVWRIIFATLLVVYWLFAAFMFIGSFVTPPMFVVSVPLVIGGVFLVKRFRKGSLKR